MTDNRKKRRSLKRQGVEVMHTTAIDGAALAAAVVQGIDVLDLVAYHIDQAVRVVWADGGDVLEHAVITIGRHPSYPEDLTVQVKTDKRRAVADEPDLGRLEDDDSEDSA